jgi:hypothetical protein
MKYLNKARPLFINVVAAEEAAAFAAIVNE